MAYSEHDVQNQIRNAALSYYRDVNIFRANVGKGFLCHKTPGDYTTLRRFDTGLPAGFPDLFDYRSLIITPDRLSRRLLNLLSLKSKRQKAKPAKSKRKCTNN